MAEARDEEDPLAPGTLWERSRDTGERALASGALEPLTTRVETVSEAGVPFVVRVLEGMKRKIDLTREQRRAGTNPFLPPDPALRVGGVSPTHLAVLNRYPVIDRHLLVLTRHHARQEATLDRDDFDAALRGLAGAPSIAFFNGGRAAGSSQGHKHLHLVPLPLGADGTAFPTEPWWAAPGAGRDLPFRNAAGRFAEDDANDARRAYERLVREAGVATAGDPRPYNLLLTRSWMAVVPRSRGLWDGIPSNGLAWAGTLFARGEAQLARIREVGPIRLLREMAQPW